MFPVLLSVFLPRTKTGPGVDPTRLPAGDGA